MKKIMIFCLLIFFVSVGIFFVGLMLRNETSKGMKIKETKVRTTYTKAKLLTISKGLDHYIRIHDKLPEPNKYIDALESESLIHEKCLDAWGNDISMTIEGTTVYTLTSAGPDGIYNTEDDINFQKGKESDIR